MAINGRFPIRKFRCPAFRAFARLQYGRRFDFFGSHDPLKFTSATPLAPEDVNVISDSQPAMGRVTLVWVKAALRAP